MRELAAIGFANIANCFDREGQLKSLEDMPTEVSATLETYKVERDSSGRIRSYHIKLHNKILALDALMDIQVDTNPTILRSKLVML